jgi:transcriptional regulator with XRE-family HTH domain
MTTTSTFTDRLSLGERLARARKATGMGQRDFSKAVGISTRSVSAYELDQRSPSFDTVVTWARVTGAPMAYFAEAIEAHRGHPFADGCRGQMSLDDVVIDLRDSVARTYIAAAA